MPVKLCYAGNRLENQPPNFNVNHHNWYTIKGCFSCGNVVSLVVSQHRERLDISMVPDRMTLIRDHFYSRRPAAPYVIAGAHGIDEIAQAGNAAVSYMI